MVVCLNLNYQDHSHNFLRLQFYRFQNSLKYILSLMMVFSAILMTNKHFWQGRQQHHRRRDLWITTPELWDANSAHTQGQGPLSRKILNLSLERTTSSTIDHAQLVAAVRDSLLTHLATKDRRIGGTNAFSSETPITTLKTLFSKLPLPTHQCAD